MIYKKSWKYILIKDDSNGCRRFNLYRVKSLKDFSDVTKGKIGGYLESYHNLSQKENCWVYDKAWVCENARVSENAKVSGNAKIYGSAIVSGNAKVFDKARVCGDTIVKGDMVVVKGKTYLSD